MKFVLTNTRRVLLVSGQKDSLVNRGVFLEGEFNNLVDKKIKLENKKNSSF